MDEWRPLVTDAVESDQQKTDSTEQHARLALIEARNADQVDDEAEWCEERRQ